MSKNCVVIQGPTHDQDRMSKAWQQYNVIYSTWEDEKPEGKIPENIIYNKKPKDPGFRNINYQVTSTLAGLKKAKEEGFDFCLKWRSDYVPSSARNLFKMFDFKYKKHNFIYNNLVKLSRNIYFYKDIKLEDKLENRMILIFAHLYLLPRRLPLLKSICQE